MYVVCVLGGGGVKRGDGGHFAIIPAVPTLIYCLSMVISAVLGNMGKEQANDFQLVPTELG